MQIPASACVLTVQVPCIDLVDGLIVGSYSATIAASVNAALTQIQVVTNRKLYGVCPVDGNEIPTEIAIQAIKTAINRRETVTTEDITGEVANVLGGLEVLARENARDVA